MAGYVSFWLETSGDEIIVIYVFMYLSYLYLTFLLIVVPKVANKANTFLLNIITEGQCGVVLDRLLDFDQGDLS